MQYCEKRSMLLNKSIGAHTWPYLLGFAFLLDSLGFHCVITLASVLSVEVFSTTATTAQSFILDDTPREVAIPQDGHSHWILLLTLWCIVKVPSPCRAVL
eukprot:4699397-Amphidinium_carterae.2